MVTGKEPEKSMRVLIENLGGIQRFISKDDIVILKTNSQWWRQGMTNTDAMAGFIRMVFEIPGFTGEVIIADNHQAALRNDRGWTTDKRNGRFNLNELVTYFNEKGHANVSKYHWHPAGPNPRPLEMDGYGDSVVAHPSDGDGYVWPEDLYYTSPQGHKTLLAYPIFTSAFSGTTIDLKNGAWKQGAYSGQPVKLINFSALNHHSPYGGVTASVKNFMGVVDMSCGWPAPKPENTFNTHHIGASIIYQLMSYIPYKNRIPYFYQLYYHPAVFEFRYTGGVLGSFMANVRKADLNIITAILVGWGSRIRPERGFAADTLLASTDPVALDYTAADRILLPASLKAGAPEKYVRLNDPNQPESPFLAFLEECRREFGGTLDKDLINVIETTA